MTTTPSAPTTHPATAHDAPSGGEFVAVLHAAMRAVRREADAQLGDDAVAPGQLRLLRMLDRAGGVQRPSVLAETLGVSPRSVTSKVDAAERDGYVVRHPDPSDRRATLVELTDRGRAVLARVGDLRASGAGGLLERLDPAEQRELVRLLRRVAGTADGPVTHP
ncbi:MarR family transcriptional regulator [Luteimicrobium xylanilyticum]|uniref:Putative HTH-type transcriptional regulator YkoM n=1 Tax=Luteimicrobium xylanilyticum TaxID=1133546 RepID=A0A5P9QA34_9MICO|nr:MarR family winged helix-turn-helix transcriptional regulator [Luteimicrobium xylanilyticum]QFU98209.1 putative HTH-type transcriptional regulator YkoM [Luteimicrobium xylanilyticum]